MFEIVPSLQAGWNKYFIRPNSMHPSDAGPFGARDATRPQMSVWHTDSEYCIFGFLNNGCIMECIPAVTEFPGCVRKCSVWWRTVA